MAKSFTVKARLEAEDRASATVEKVEGRFSRLGSFLKDRFVITLGDVSRAVSSVAGVFGDMVTASAEAERAGKALDAALSGLGSGAAAVAANLKAQADALQATTRFEDDAIKSGQALLATYTQNEEQLKKSTQAAVDFAAATGIELNSAFALLSKAAAGSTESLSRYGIILDENIPPAEKFEALLKKMNTQFGGRAAADVETFSGALAQLRNAYGDLQEKAGDAITQNKEITATLAKLKGLLTDEGTIQAVEELTLAFAKLTKFAVETTTGFFNLTRAFAAWTQSGNEVEISTAAMEKTAKRLGITVEQLRDRLKESAIAGNEFSQTARLAAEATAKAAKAADGASASQDNYTDAILRNQRAQQALNETAKSFTEAVHEMGITLEEDVNKEMEKNAELMEQAEQLYRRGVITRQDFERVQRAVADANDEATESLLEQVDAFDELTSATGSSAEGFESFRRSVRDTRSELDSFSTTSARAASSQSKFATNAITGGKSSFATISGGQFSTPAGSTLYYDSRSALRWKA